MMKKTTFILYIILLLLIVACTEQKKQNKIDWILEAEKECQTYDEHDFLKKCTQDENNTYFCYIESKQTSQGIFCNINHYITQNNKEKVNLTTICQSEQCIHDWTNMDLEIKYY